MICLLAFIAFLAWPTASQPHPGRCPELGYLPPTSQLSSNSCYWVVNNDWRMCKTYVEQCGRRNPCPGINEVLWICSSECEPTCQDKWPGCGNDCGPPKCQCAGDHARNASGVCVKLFECPENERAERICGENEEFVACSSLCEPACTSPSNQPCPLGCGSPRCQCKSGFIRYNGRCISKSQCPSQRTENGDGIGGTNDNGEQVGQGFLPHYRCGPNEEFFTCTSMCEPTCFSQQNQRCPLACGPSGCQCRSGFVRHNGRCILRSQCPPPPPPIYSPSNRCERNEEFVACSSLCEPTCFSPPNQPCPLGCGPPQCQCRSGFVRHHGRCILRSQCPSSPIEIFPPPRRCGTYEEFVACSSLCEPTCFSPPNQPCPLGCGPPQCQCRSGFVRHHGRCILRSQCPPPSAPIPPSRCGPNEEFLICSSLCEPTCFTRPNGPCPAGCGPPSCQCISGFVRDNGVCIPRNHCFRFRNERDCRTEECAPSASCRSMADCFDDQYCVSGHCVKVSFNDRILEGNVLQSCTTDKDCRRAGEVCVDQFCHLVVQ